jgi:hypothetical protein
MRFIASRGIFWSFGRTLFFAQLRRDFLRTLLTISPYASKPASENTSHLTKRGSPSSICHFELACTPQLQRKCTPKSRLHESWVPILLKLRRASTCRMTGKSLTGRSIFKSGFVFFLHRQERFFYQLLQHKNVNIAQFIDVQTTNTGFVLS